MKEVNALVELAKEISFKQWRVNADEEVTAADNDAGPDDSGEVFIACTANIQLAKYIAAASPETILAIAEAFQALQQQLTNAQEALKSAGIEADTVQAGVMELVAQNAALVAEVINIREQAEDVYAAGYRHGHLNTADGIAYAPSVEDEFYHNALQVMAEVEAPATDAYLNAVRAEGVEMLAESLIENGVCTSSHTVGYFKQFAAQLRAGNAGKDGV